MTSRWCLLVFVAIVLPRAATAQQASTAPQAATGRTFELGAMQQAAVDTDPRLRQLQLLMTQTELRLRNIAVARRPAMSIEGVTQYQSDVPRAPFTLPNGERLLSPAKATIDGSLRVDQRLFDATIPAQDALERAQLAEQQARVRTTLFGLRQQVNDAFFAAAALQARAGALAAVIEDLEARLREMTARVNEGTALPADAAAIEATLLERRQDEDALRASRRAALASLARLTGQAMAEDDVLTWPDLGAQVARARQAPESLRARPEYEQFSRSTERLARQRDLSAAQERPRLSAFGRGGYGLPGLNFINDEFQVYGLGGVRLQWNAWTWGTGAREREALAIQQQVVATEQAAFAKGLLVATESDETAIDRLRAALMRDERIVMLREQVVRSTQVRLQEGVVTASEYLDRTAELLQARYSRTGHEVELAEASARLLTTLGLEVR